MNIVCVGGAPSSGTTLLADLLDSVPGFLCGPEANVFCLDVGYEFNKYMKVHASHIAFPCNAIYSPKSRFFNRRYCENFGLSLMEVDAAIQASESLSDFIKTLANKFSIYRDKPLTHFVEKTPVNIGYIKPFLNEFPNGYFIRVIRDGRAVVASLRRRGYSLLEAALIWIYQNRLGLVWADHPRVITIRFEELARNPYDTVAEACSLMGVDVFSDTIRAEHAKNLFRASLPRVTSWRVKSTIPDEKVSRNPCEQFLPDDLNFLDAFSVRSVYDPPVFTEISFRAMQKILGYSENGNLLDVSEATVRKELSAYVSSTNNLECQATIDFPWAYAERLNLRSQLNLEESVNQNELSDFWKYYGPTGLCPTLNELEPALAALSRRIYLPSIRTFPLRKTHVDMGTDGSLKTRILAVLSELIEMYMQLMTRRAQAKQPLRSEDALLLALSLHEYRMTIGKPWSDEAILMAQASNVIGKSAQQICDKGWQEFLVGKVTCTGSMASELLTRHLFTDNGKKRVELDLVTGLLLKLLSSEFEDDRTFDQLDELIESRSGIIYATPQISGNPNFRRQIYTRPLFVLVLLLMAKLKAVKIKKSQTVQSVRMARETGGAGMDDRRQSERLIRYALQINKLPILKDSYNPVDISTSRLEFEGEVRKVLMFKADRRRFKHNRMLTLSIRHDIDRKLTEDDFVRIQKFEKKYGLRSSWYFKPETFDSIWVEQLIEDGFEVGYHASDIKTGDGGFSDMLRSRYPGLIRGCNFHGGFGSSYWKGQESIVAAQRLGYSYSENPADIFAHPFPYKGELGPIYLTAAPLRIQSHPKNVAAHLELLIKSEGHVIVENHPDRFDKGVMNIISSVLNEKPNIRTVGEHVDECAVEFENRTAFMSIF